MSKRAARDPCDEGHILCRVWIGVSLMVVVLFCSFAGGGNWVKGTLESLCIPF